MTGEESMPVMPSKLKKIIVSFCLGQFVCLF